MQPGFILLCFKSGAENPRRFGLHLKAGFSALDGAVVHGVFNSHILHIGNCAAREHKLHPIRAYGDGDHIILDVGHSAVNTADGAHAIPRLDGSKHLFDLLIPLALGMIITSINTTIMMMIRPPPLKKLAIDVMKSEFIPMNTVLI